jgi:hypothetical protein
MLREEVLWTEELLGTAEEILTEGVLRMERVLGTEGVLGVSKSTMDPIVGLSTSQNPVLWISSLEVLEDP